MFLCKVLLILLKLHGLNLPIKSIYGLKIFVLAILTAEMHIQIKSGDLNIVLATQVAIVAVTWFRWISDRSWASGHGIVIS